MKPRKYIYQRNLPHIEKDDRAHFITFDAYQRWHLPPAARDIALAHCLHDNGSKMHLHVAVVMPDHVHLIFTPLRCETDELYSFEEIVGSIKGASAHTINRKLKRSGTVWQDESFDHIIRHQESMKQKIQYVCENPVRRGLVTRPEDYKWLWKEPQPRAAVPHGPGKGKKSE
jgi:REP element-mobilizing transposase RayT